MKTAPRVEADIRLSILYFHYGTSYENPICSHHYTVSAYRCEDVFVPSARIFVALNKNAKQKLSKKMSSPTHKIELLIL